MPMTVSKPRPRTPNPAVPAALPDIAPIVPILRITREASPERVAEGILPIAEIQEEAYALFLGRGGEHGHNLDDWLAAETLVRERRRNPRA